MTTLYLLLVICIVLGGVLCGSAYALNSVSGDDSISELESRVQTDRADFRVQPAETLQDEPSIFRFVTNSNYVVAALLTEVKIVSRAKKPEKQNPEANADGLIMGTPLEDAVAGFLFSFQVENVIYSKSSLQKNASPGQSNLQNFQIFVPAKFHNEHYEKDHRYLIFLETQPEPKKLIKDYDLDEQKIYYRAFDGKTVSLFWRGGSEMHLPSTKGIIDLSKSEYWELAQRIETFCSALDEPDVKSRLRSLRELTDSSDEELKNNAAYAIKALPGL